MQPYTSKKIYYFLVRESQNIPKYFVNIHINDIFEKFNQDHYPEWNSFEQFVEIIENWAEEHMSGKIYEDLRYPSYGTYFDNKEDLSIFKITFG